MNKLKLKLKLKKLHEVIHNLKLKTLDKEEIMFEDFTELSNRVDTLLDIVIHDTKPNDIAPIRRVIIGSLEIFVYASSLEVISESR